MGVLRSSLIAGRVAVVLTIRDHLLLAAEAGTVPPAVLGDGHSLVSEEPPEPDDVAASDDMTGADGAVTFAHGTS